MESLSRTRPEMTIKYRERWTSYGGKAEEVRVVTSKDPSAATASCRRNDTCLYGQGVPQFNRKAVTRLRYVSVDFPTSGAPLGMFKVQAGPVDGFVASLETAPRPQVYPR